MELLVSVPAAVEDALASLMLDPSEPTLQYRGTITYIRRLYHPYLLGTPSLSLLRGAATPPTGGHAAETASSSDGGIIAVSTWLFEDPSAYAPIPLADDGNSSGGGGRGVGRRTRAGALLLLHRLSALAPGLQRVQSEVSALGVGRPPLTLHIVLAASAASASSSSGQSSINGGDMSTTIFVPSNEGSLHAVGTGGGVGTGGVGTGDGVSIDASLVRLDDGLSLVSRADIGEASEVHPETTAKAAEQVMTGSE